jgi:predicted peptidase
MKFLLLTTLLLFCSGLAICQNREQFEKKEFIRGNDTLRYRILYPINYQAGRHYAEVIFLHGSGERGSDNNAQLTWGADLFLDSGNREKFPAIIIFPQCPANDSWARLNHTGAKDSVGGFVFLVKELPTKPLSLVMQLADETVQTGMADPKHIYLGGLSMGGFGTFELLWRKPHFFAAAFPICGGGEPSTVDQYAKKFPIWIFHGGSDPVVPVGNSRRMVIALSAAGGKVRYDEYPGVGHDSWKNAFAENDLLAWLFKQKKRR